MDSVKSITKNILAELGDILDKLDEAQIAALLERIKEAKRIFCAGAGRSRLMISGFAMRLMHMEYEAYLVGEVVTPAIREGDLLIIASGSGSTASLLGMAQKAKGIGAKLALITINTDSPIAELADCIVCIDAASTKRSGGGGRTSFQLGANSFEQSLLLMLDALSIGMMTEECSIEESNKKLMERHANLE